MTDFKLSAQLVGHEADVRAVCFLRSDTVITASRDCTVRLWRRETTPPTSFESHVVNRTSEYINSLTYINPSREHQRGLVVSAGKDTVIDVRSPDTSLTDNAERLLVGHAQNICTLDVSPEGSFLVSGGWDGQARVWDIRRWETMQVLVGHDGMAVWSCVALDERRVVTGCADKIIRLYDLKASSDGENRPISTITTPDVVRALCKVPSNHPSGADIASASNDGILRLWMLSGQQVGELHGHESFVYSLASLPSGELVSSGEDRTLRIWRGLECVQTITHPAISVWAVATNSLTGDIISGASDGVARIFTRHPELIADSETLELFHGSVKSSSIPQQQLGGINKEKLPGPEFLTTKSGTKEGQVQMIKEENENITAYQWSVSQQQWISVGTVVDTAGSTGRKVEYSGQSYDHVFDVDIEDGKPPLKLPYNLSENPYERARKFLGDNELPLSYLDNVANFIVENTKGTVLSQVSQRDSSDSQGKETQDNPKPDELLKWQGARVLPQTDYLSISAAKNEAIFSKILSINKNMVSSGLKDTALNPGEEDVLKILQEAIELSKPIPAEALPLIVKIVTLWPYADRLPGLDLLRCVAMYPLGARFVDHVHGSLVEIASSTSTQGNLPLNENAVMMGARVIVNLFSSAEGRSLISSKADKAIMILERLVGATEGRPVGKFNRSAAIAVATAAINFSVMIRKEKSLSSEQRRRLVVVIGLTLEHQSDPEVIYRALVALGTVLTSSGGLFANLELSRWIQEAKQKSSETRIISVAEECVKILSQSDD